MSGRRVRLADVARQAGVSPTTASFVLTGRDDMRISPAAKQRVRAAARELGYRPNLTARSLRTQVTRTIGFVSDTIATEPFAGEMVRGAVNAAIAGGHLLLIAESEGDVDVERRLVREMIDRQVDGLVYASMFTREVQVPKELAGQPLVLLNCVAGDDLPSVVPDELAAGRAAAQVLLDAGHDEAIHIVGEPAPDVFAGRERVAGITEALRAAGTAAATDIHCSWWPEPAYRAVRAFLDDGGAPRALICMNDRVALGTYQALLDAGLGVGRDVSVVSFDDSDLASWVRPALTSVGLPHDAMGRKAVELLLEPEERPRVHRIPMNLRLRGSVRA